jgi:hypothetical protein
VSLLFASQDEKVAIKATRLRNMADHIVLPTSNDLAANNPLAIWQVMHFLKHGHFFHLFGRREPKVRTQQIVAA